MPADALQQYLHLTGNTPGGPKWGPKGAPVNRLPEVTGGGGESEKTVENVIYLGLSGEVQVGGPPFHFGEIGGGGFGVVSGPVLGCFRLGFWGCQGRLGATCGSLPDSFRIPWTKLL